VNTSPFIAALFAWVVLKEHMSRISWLGLLVSFLGVAILVFTQWTGKGSMLGGIFAILAATSFAGYTVFSRALFQSLPLWDVLLATSLWGNVFLWVGVVVTGQVPSVVSALASLTAPGWGQLAYIVIVVSTLAYGLYGYGLKRVPTGIASAVTFYPQALFAAIIQWVWVGIVPSVFVAVSAVFILLGTALMRKS
jgi:drug/metabolite transporter (DMT)-like permease